MSGLDEASCMQSLRTSPVLQSSPSARINDALTTTYTFAHAESTFCMSAANESLCRLHLLKALVPVSIASSRHAAQG